MSHIAAIITVASAACCKPRQRRRLAIVSRVRQLGKFTMDVHQIFASILRLNHDLSTWRCSSASRPYSRSRAPEPTNVGGQQSTIGEEKGDISDISPQISLRAELELHSSFHQSSPSHCIVAASSAALMRSGLPSRMERSVDLSTAYGSVSRMAIQACLDSILISSLRRRASPLATHSSLLSG